MKLNNQTISNICGTCSNFQWGEKSKGKESSSLFDVEKKSISENYYLKESLTNEAQLMKSMQINPSHCLFYSFL